MGKPVQLHDVTLTRKGLGDIQVHGIIRETDAGSLREFIPQMYEASYVEPPRSWLVLGDEPEVAAKIEGSPQRFFAAYSPEVLQDGPNPEYFTKEYQPFDIIVQHLGDKGWSLYAKGVSSHPDEVQAMVDGLNEFELRRAGRA